MSLVVFPFKEESLTVIATNLRTAASHPRVEEVWAMAADEGRIMEEVTRMAREVAVEAGKPVRVFPQERIGVYRPGKGDGMNTALRRAAEEGWDRVHFYDADITNFDQGWIDGAEAAADRGHIVVRHRFPRAATDAMITWMVTRPALAMAFPGTLLPRLGQPLGGEILLSAEAVAELASNRLVADRSDWGIDTVITFASAKAADTVYEHHVADGKRHALYGSLDEIRVMMLECLDTVRSLGGLEPPGAVLVSEPSAPVPEDLKRSIGYDLDVTKALLTEGWTGDEAALAEGLRPDLSEQVLVNRTSPHYEFMDAGAWEPSLRFLLNGFLLGDPAWERLAFRLWLMRVISYTETEASRGYDHAIAYLEGTIRRYETLADQHGRR